jgi:hypothetical protein
MNEIDRIAALAAQADRSASAPPLPDLADRVLADIRRGGRGRFDDGGSRVWQATAAATCALAIVAAVTAARSWSSLQNPLSDLSDTPNSVNSVEMR